MENRIEGKWILITGASSGIGEACARKCAAGGAHLALTARREERLLALKKELERGRNIRVHCRRLDVRDRADVFRYVEELKGEGIVPDVLVNNAGLASGLGKLQEGSFDDWDRMIDTNVKGLLNVSRAVLPLMVARNRGHVVNVGSIAGFQVYPGGNVYNASKYAVRALSEGMNVDLLGTEIRVSAVSPGAVRTEFSDVRFHGDREKADRVYEGFVPLSGEDVAECILFILNAPPHVNIQNLVVTPTAQRNVYSVQREPGKGSS
ncbi:MAG TPA: SDR family NAD(P)-dependent oxidoreductase [Syntrophales bacterium]|nr:SDR family NAD(P)-dependent oxidoreductase [Syntrophales bacterium]HPX11418.1 SDR family NAD(P)-dependent oxidoreductase [Syntrophales bacterium]HQB29853.1 SDR family NAD(P)-dependent oxidoreductase [Syntrophales bacterium]HQN77241.1 SDR family NAD(P)-dependent oxidoreductase [Syntrophales bacterium]HQQ26245.1 SDR family NAD(P)-dependent oxidoreductase [Syntrophales bacterium]